MYFFEGNMYFPHPFMQAEEGFSLTFRGVCRESNLALPLTRPAHMAYNLPCNFISRFELGKSGASPALSRNGKGREV